MPANMLMATSDQTSFLRSTSDFQLLTRHPDSSVTQWLEFKMEPSLLITTRPTARLMALQFTSWLLLENRVFFNSPLLLPLTSPFTTPLCKCCLWNSPFQKKNNNNFILYREALNFWYFEYLLWIISLWKNISDSRKIKVYNCSSQHC